MKPHTTGLYDLFNKPDNVISHEQIRIFPSNQLKNNRISVMSFSNMSNPATSTGTIGYKI